MENEKILVTKSSMPRFEKYIEKIQPLWENHWLTNMGVLHQQFEKELKAKMQSPFVTLFVNGHMALEMAIRSLELKGEVITTPFTFASTTNAIVRNGLTPVFCDIDPETYTIDVNKIESLINEKTCAILPVHVYGTICDVEAIQEIAEKYHLKVIYDAAHAFNVKYKNVNIGNYGDMSMFSFHATKVFNSIEGGALSYKEEKYKKKLDALKNFGIVDGQDTDIMGVNAKMNEFQAAMGLCNLEELDEQIDKRQKVFERYNMHLDGIAGIKLRTKQKNVDDNYAYYPIVCDSKILNMSRDYICEELKKANIYVRKYFYPLTCDLKCYNRKDIKQSVPIARRISQSVITLPLYADLPIETVDKICATLFKILRR